MSDGIGALSSAIHRLSAIIDGRVPTSPRTLMVAQCEGRDYFAGLRMRRDAHARLLVELAEQKLAAGLTVRRMAEYREWLKGRYP